MIQLYHPNKSNTGSAASFWFSERDNVVYATILKQSGWDDKSRNGTFKASMADPLKKTNIKFSFVEVCGILDSIERNRSFSSYHDNEDFSKSIKFEPYLDKTSNAAKGSSFSVLVKNKQDTSTSNSFLIGFTFAEARYIREFLVYCLHKKFDNKTQNSVPPSQHITENITGQSQEQSNNLTDSESNQVENLEGKPVADWIDPLKDF